LQQIADVYYEDGCAKAPDECICFFADVKSLFFAEKPWTWWKVLKWILIVLLVILVLGGVIYFCFIYHRQRTQALGESERTQWWQRLWPFGYSAPRQQADNSPDPSPLLADTSSSQS
jgi:hypothetical protein